MIYDSAVTFRIIGEHDTDSAYELLQEVLLEDEILRQKLDRYGIEAIYIDQPFRPSEM